MKVCWKLSLMYIVLDGVKTIFVAKSAFKVKQILQTIGLIFETLVQGQKGLNYYSSNKNKVFELFESAQLWSRKTKIGMANRNTIETVKKTFLRIGCYTDNNKYFDKV